MFFTFKPKNGNELLGTSEETKNFSFLYLTTELCLHAHKENNKFYNLMIDKKVDYFKALINQKPVVFNLLDSQKETFDIVYKNNIECLKELRSMVPVPITKQDLVNYTKMNKKLYKNIMNDIEEDYVKITNFLNCLEKFNYKDCFQDLPSLKLFNQYLCGQIDKTISIKYLNSQLGAHINVAKLNKVNKNQTKKAF